MAETMHSKILWRMTGRASQEEEEQAQPSGRALRLAVARVANDSVGLVLTVTGMAEQTLPLDGMLDGLDAELMLIGLERDGRPAGVFALDMQLRAAVLEMQTIGSVIAAAADTRAATRTDKAMCDPLVTALLDALPAAMAGSPLDGWTERCRLGQQIDSARAAGLILGDCDYRVLRMTVDLGVADRQGLILIALPPLAQVAKVEPELIDHLDWGTQFRLAVSDAPATLSAQLHRFTLPLAQARALQVGQVLPLPGCNVHSVRLVSTDGHRVAQAKLGQLAGMRAVRIETAPPPRMSDLPAGGAGVSHDDAGLLSLDIGDGAMMDDMPGDGGFGSGPDLMLDDDPLPAMDDDFPMASMDMDALGTMD